MSATKKAVQEGSDREDNDGNSHNGVLGNQYDEVEYNREDEIVGRAAIMMRNVKPMIVTTSSREWKCRCKS